jgi:dual specificity protein kinase YAK1
MDQWQAYSSTGGGARRFDSNSQAGQPQQAREYGSGGAQPNYRLDQYQGATNPASQGQSMVASTPNTPQTRDGNGDVAMQDIGDPYSGVKYPMRPHHQQHLSSSSRSGLHPQSPQEQSSAAQRYSPMEAVSGATPYITSPQTSQNPYTNRQSPTRSSYSSPNSYYSSRQQVQQLPPITPYSSNNSQDSYPPSATTQLNAVFGNDPKSPRRPHPAAAPPPVERGPIPQFAKLRSVSDLQPQINAQPAFRRANPEGGFISVSRNPCCRLTPLIIRFSHYKLSRHTCHQHTEYATQCSNTSHPETPEECSRSRARERRMTGLTTRTAITFYMSTISLVLKRRVISKLCCNPDTSMSFNLINCRNRYLILDVLGQGTFGQVVKCQNLKTQEVVAVKVIKNKTAYFNQSMMEVSVLDLVRIGP